SHARRKSPCARATSARRRFLISRSAQATAVTGNICAPCTRRCKRPTISPRSERVTSAERKLEGTVLVTGGAGFIGSAVVRALLADHDVNVVNVDKLTYAANLASVPAKHPRYRLEIVDICDGPSLQRLFSRYLPSAVIHLAAESHVDRS